MLQKELEPITPRGLIMSLFNAPDTAELGISQIIQAGSLFSFEAAAIRMATTRLIKDGLIASTKRGVYTAGEKAINLNSEAQNWRTADQKTKPWKQEWLMAITSHLGRTNKTQLRSMLRAFQLTGFVQIELGVWIRPSNLALTIDQLHQSLVELGMEPRTYLLVVAEVAGEHKQSWHSHWPVVDIEARYQRMIDRLEQSQASLKKMSPQDAAKESLIVGESAIRLINLDPLLPKEIIDTRMFKKVVSSMVAYDNLGQQCWQRFLSA